MRTPKTPVKPLTVNVPTTTLHLAKTRASLEGQTMRDVVTQALTAYAEGLKTTLAGLGFVEKAPTTRRA